MTDRERWWGVISYEVWMIGETQKMVAPQGPLHNVCTESRVLHARNLCKFCSPRKWPTDLKPEDLFDDYDEAPAYSVLRGLVGAVKAAYETDACTVPLPPDGKTTALKSPKWAFDKMLAHPTQDRGTSFDYKPFLDLVVPKIKLVAEDLTRLEKAQGRDFPRTSAPFMSV
jgi:hypothetical protein